MSRELDRREDRRERKEMGIEAPPTALARAGKGVAPLRRLWAARGIWLGALAYAGSLVFTLMLVQGEPARTWAWVGLIVCALLGILAWSGQRWLPAFSPALWAAMPRLAVRVDAERILRFLLICLSLALTWLANQQFLHAEAETFGLAGWLWLGAMALLLIAVVSWPAPAEHRAFSRAWVITLGKAKAEESQARPEEISTGAVAQDPVQPRWSWWEVGALVGLVGLAFAVRLWDLTNFPYAIRADEIITGRVASQAYITGDNPSIFRTLWNNIDLPALWFVGVAEALRLGNATLAALRAPAAIFGAAATIPVYFLVRSVWGQAAAIAGTAIMAFSVSEVHFSRVTINNITTSFFWATCFFFVLRGLRRGRPVDWALAGLFGGLGEYGYYGTRLLWVVLIVFGLYLLVFHWRRAVRHLGHFGLVGIGYVVAMGPLIAWFTQNPLLYFGRKPGARPLTWDHIPTSLDDLHKMWDTLWPITAGNLLRVSTLGSTDDFYTYKLLMPAEAALLVLGVALLVWRWRHPASFLLLAAGIGVLVTGGTLVPFAGNINHWTPAFPSFYAALAVPVGAAAWVLGRLAGSRLRVVGAVALAGGLCALGFTDIYFYFNQYYETRPEFDIQAAKARYQAELGTGYRVRSVGRTWQLYDPETTGYLIKGIDGAQIFNPATELPLPGEPGKSLAFTFFGDQEQYLPIVHSLYPGGKDGEVDSHAGPLIFKTYTVDASRAAADYGVYVQVFEAGSQTTTREGKVDAFGNIPSGTHLPARVRWSAGMYWGTPDPIQLEVTGVAASVFLDGLPYKAPSVQPTQPGWHRVLVEAELNEHSGLRLLAGEQWPPQAAPLRSTLWPDKPGAGLLATISGGSGETYHRVAPFLGYTGLAQTQAISPLMMASPPARVRWAGEVLTEQPGNYTFELAANGVARLFLAGELASQSCSPVDLKPVLAAKPMTAGWHSIQIDYGPGAASTTLELYWTRPGGERELVPPEALRFAKQDVFGALSRVQAPQVPRVVTCDGP